MLYLLHTTALAQVRGHLQLLLLVLLQQLLLPGVV
jgi:hypothetical protein